MTTTRQSWSHNVFVQVLFIILLSFISGLVFNHFSPGGIPLISGTADTVSGKEISVERAYQFSREDRALFIDTRYPEEYRKGHINQAVNVPANWSMDQIMNFFRTVPKDRLLIVYCSSAECNSSQRLAGFLVQIGFNNVMVFPDGYKSWLAKNYPVVLSENILGDK